ncbi:MAG: hypothetical protein R3E02_14420 [Blastomonas sp.]
MTLPPFRLSCRAVLLSTVLALPATPLLAQDNPDEPLPGLLEDESADSEPEGPIGNLIVVTGGRMRGSVETDVTPIETLSAADVASYGASSLEDLLSALAPQTGSGRRGGGGRPAILLNGQRISGFRAIRDLPPEAIERVEVFPEELALQYGFPPDQRVINFILKPNFASLTSEIEYGQPTAGGYSTKGVEATLTRIGEQSRLVIDLEYEHQTSLLESERGIIQSETIPYAPGGNIVSSPFVTGGEIDPALSALAGQAVSVAGVPTGLAGAPLLSDFLGDANSGDLGQFRTLIGGSDQFEANATYARSLSTTTNFQINGAYTHRTGQSLFGLNTGLLTVDSGNPFSPFSVPVQLAQSFPDARPLTRNTQSDSYQAGLSLNGRVGDWRWTVTGDFNRTESETKTDRRFDFAPLQALIDAGDPALNPFALSGSDLVPAAGRDTTRLASQTLTGALTLAGELVELPAGPIRMTLDVKGQRYSLRGSNSRLGAAGDTRQSRGEAGGTVNVDVPILMPESPVGRFSVNGNLGQRHLGDFGGLTSFGGGFNWSPLDRLSIQGSFVGEEAAPGISQLGDPVIVTPNVTIFDQVRGETVLASIISGGNPLLTAERRRDFKFSLNYSPDFLEGLTFLAEYFRNRSYDVTAGFPTLTPEIEAAFPGRIVRDMDGTLVSIDRRAVSFDRTANDRLRYGVLFSKSFGQQGRGGPGAGGPGRGGPGAGGGRPEGERGNAGREGRAGETRTSDASAQAEGSQPSGEAGQQPVRRQQAQSRGEARGARGAGGMMRRGGGRWNIALFHEIRLVDTILIRPGVPELDLLNGSATGSGGTARHRLELEGGWFSNGVGVRVAGNYASGTTVDGGATPGATQLNYGDLATFNLRAFFNFDSREKLVAKHPVLKGVRLALRVDNVFDAHQRVTDQNGQVPLGFQPDLIDPRGRYFEISLRKRF